MPTFVTVSDPADENTTDMPIFDGSPSDAYRVLVPGLYPATEYTYTDHGDFVESGHVFVWDGTRAYPSAGIAVGDDAGSVFVGETCGVCGCAIHDPHNHTTQYFFGYPTGPGINVQP